ncbi:hypothetical protein ACHAXH_007296 [Discostella pseudostelligera]
MTADALGSIGNNHTIPSSNYEDQRIRTSILPWPDIPPLYLGPMHLENINGSMGRGYVASIDLPPGTCILIETPLISGWSTSQSGKRLGLESVQYILESKKNNVNEIVKWMEELHPRKEKVDACSPWLFPLFQGEGDVSNSMNEDEDDNKNRSIDPIDRIQIVDMMSEIMMPSTSSTATSTDDDDNNNSHHPMQQQVHSLVYSLVSYAAQHNIHNSNGTPLIGIDIVRLLLTLRYNGFDSGLYLHFSMFNHGEDPNCIKFRPPTLTSTTRATTVEAVGKVGEKATPLPYSEARTTRYIRKGEALTLHYLENPREVSHSSRRRQLWDQHRFDIGGDGGAYGQYLDGEAFSTSGYLLHDTTRGRYIYESELIHGEFPASVLIEANNGEDNGSNTIGGDSRNSHTSNVTSNIEKSLDELEDILIDLQASTPSPKSSSSKRRTNKDGTTSTSSSTISYYFDQAAALELTIGELITASVSILGNNLHILLARCRHLHIDVVELLLSTSLLTERQSNELMTRFILSAQQLLESQRRRLGGDHPDVARTCHDYCMGIQALLSHAPRRLLLLEMVDEADDEVEKKTKKGDGTRKTTRWTLDQWSKMEHHCRNEKKRIEELYPNDVEAILKSVQKME